MITSSSTLNQAWLLLLCASGSGTYNILMGEKIIWKKSFQLERCLNVQVVYCYKFRE